MIQYIQKYSEPSPILEVNRGEWGRLSSHIGDTISHLYITKEDDIDINIAPYISLLYMRQSNILDYKGVNIKELRLYESYFNHRSNLNFDIIILGIDSRYVVMNTDADNIHNFSLNDYTACITNSVTKLCVDDFGVDCTWKLEINTSQMNSVEIRWIVENCTGLFELYKDKILFLDETDHMLTKLFLG